MSCTDLIRTSACELMISHFHLCRNVSIVIVRLVSAWLTSVIVFEQPEQLGMIAKNGVGSNFLIQYSCFVSADNSTATSPPSCFQVFYKLLAVMYNILSSHRWYSRVAPLEIQLMPRKNFLQLYECGVKSCRRNILQMPHLL